MTQASQPFVDSALDGEQDRPPAEVAEEDIDD